MLDNNTISILREVGLTDSELMVYACGLGESRTSSVIRQLTGLPRPTVMVALKALQDYGICSAEKLDGRSSLYLMLPPQNLQKYLGGKAQELDRLMDRVSQIRLGEQLTTSVQHASSQDKIQEMLELALRCKTRQWHIIAPKDNALRYLPVSYIEYFKRVRADRQIQSQSLWESGSINENISLRDTLMRKPRYVPLSIGDNIPSLLLAFDDKLLVIEGTTDPTGLLITSKATADTFRLLFTMGWRFARQS